MKTILSILLSLVFTIPLWSQESASKPQFGLSVSPQIAHIMNRQSLFDSKASIGYSLQAFIIDDVSSRLQLYGGLGFQHSKFRQRDNSLQFPADVMNGVWVPGKSYIEYSVEYSAVGIPLGLKLQLGEKANHFFLSSSAQYQFLFDPKEKLVLNESGHFSELNPDTNGIVFEKTQLLFGVGLGYDFSLGTNSRMSIEPFFNYSLKEIHRPRQNFLEVGGRPFFMGFRIAFYTRGNKSI